MRRRGYRDGILVDGTLSTAKVALYVIQCGEFCKVGIAESPERRLRAVLSHNPFPAHLAFQMPSTAGMAPMIEHAAHQLLREHHHRGEWFTCSPDLATLALRSAAAEAPQPPALHAPKRQISPARRAAAFLRKHEGALIAQTLKFPHGTEAKILARLRAVRDGKAE